MGGNIEVAQEVEDYYYPQPPDRVNTPRLTEWMVILGGIILYLNMMAASRQNLLNMTGQVESLSSELNQTETEILEKLQVEQIS